uniref:Uncharacterized protein n=1 Tax=Physcomitrium patens TaxID=3218 RepID=A0A2K1KNL8_PHYPA|nr:hypothetical protein PHYPA_006269 [Physcomitrium patens]
MAETEIHEESSGEARGFLRASAAVRHSVASLASIALLLTTRRRHRSYVISIATILELRAPPPPPRCSSDRSSKSFPLHCCWVHIRRDPGSTFFDLSSISDVWMRAILAIGFFLRASCTRFIVRERLRFEKMLRVVSTGCNISQMGRKIFGGFLRLILGLNLHEVARSVGLTKLGFLGGACFNFSSSHGIECLCSSNWTTL